MDLRKTPTNEQARVALCTCNVLFETWLRENENVENSYKKGIITYSECEFKKMDLMRKYREQAGNTIIDLFISPDSFTPMSD